MVNKMAQGCGLNLAILYEKHKTNTGFKYVFAFKITMPISGHHILLHYRHCSVREVEICRLANPDIQRFMPVTYSTSYNPSKVCTTLNSKIFAYASFNSFKAI